MSIATWIDLWAIQGLAYIHPISGAGGVAVFGMIIKEGGAMLPTFVTGLSFLFLSVVVPDEGVTASDKHPHTVPVARANGYSSVSGPVAKNGFSTSFQVQLSWGQRASQDDTFAAKSARVASLVPTGSYSFIVEPVRSGDDLAAQVDELPVPSATYPAPVVEPVSHASASSGLVEIQNPYTDAPGVYSQAIEQEGPSSRSEVRTLELKPADDFVKVEIRPGVFVPRSAVSEPPEILVQVADSPEKLQPGESDESRFTDLLGKEYREQHPGVSQGEVEKFVKELAEIRERIEKNPEPVVPDRDDVYYSPPVGGNPNYPTPLPVQSGYATGREGSSYSSSVQPWMSGYARPGSRASSQAFRRAARELAMAAWELEEQGNFAEADELWEQVRSLRELGRK